MNSPLNVFSSLLATSVRGMQAINVGAHKPAPAQLLRLYDIENCPFCRMVREALTELNLDVVILPCPKNGTRFREELVSKAGKAQFPYLEDPNTDTAMYESIDIVEYLFKQYGTEELPLRWRLSALQKISSGLASSLRPHAGMSLDKDAAANNRQADTRKKNIDPEQLLVLYSFESSPFARLVRERLCELETPYIIRNCGRTSVKDWLPPKMRDTLNIEPDSVLANRLHLLEKEGKISIPYMDDPKTGVSMFESDAIIDYLNNTYS